MKPLLTALLVLLAFLRSYAQIPKLFVLNLETAVPAEKPVVPFSAIEIIDARFDQTNVGTVVKDFSFKGISENKMTAVFPGNLQSYLPTFLKNVLVQNGSDTLVMLVKQFRMADHLENTVEKYHEPESVLSIAASFYLRKTTKLTKLFSIDEVQTRKWEVFEDASLKEIAAGRTEALTELLTALFRNRTWTASPSSFSVTDVEQGMDKRFRLPVLLDTVLHPGLYKSFEEFKNNKPSFTQGFFGSKNGEIKEVVDNDRNPIDIKGYWGACDGKNRFIVFGRTLYKLFPSGKGFRFLSYRFELQQRLPGENILPDRFLINPVQLINAFQKDARREYFDVNMETGQAHLEEMIGSAALRKARRPV